MNSKTGAYSRPGAIDPWEHNRIVARRKRFRRIARDFRRAAGGMNRSFRDLARAADHAAESLRGLGRQLERFRDVE